VVIITIVKLVRWIGHVGLLKHLWSISRIEIFAIFNSRRQIKKERQVYLLLLIKEWMR